MNFSYLRREPGFYRRVFTLALPVVLQNLITTSLGFMDTFMVGLVGQEQMSAVTVANVPIYIIQLIVFGLQSGSRVLISQFWGRGDRESINRVMGIGFFVAGGISTLCALTMGLFPRQVLMLITDNARLVELGTSYIRIVGFSYILNSLSSIYIGMQQSIENPRFGMTVFAISTVCNTVGNYILIFGKLGAARTGDHRRRHRHLLLPCGGICHFPCLRPALQADAPDARLYSPARQGHLPQLCEILHAGAAERDFSGVPAPHSTPSSWATWRAAQT